MSTSSIRRRTGRQHTVEHEALSEIASEAEARLAAKREARAEAREIRMREIERQQLEDQEKDRLKNRSENKKDSTHTPSYTSRRGDIDSLEDFKSELSDLQEKYVKMMTHNAKLDNDKQTLTFRVTLLTEDLDDLNEACTELKRQLKDKIRDFEHKKKAHELLEATVAQQQEELQQRDLLIQEHGLIFVSDDVSGEEDEDNTDGRKHEDLQKKKKSALVSQKALEVLQNFTGTLDERLVKLDEEKNAMEKLVKKLKRDLDEERERRSVTSSLRSHSPTPNRFNNGGGNGEAAALTEGDSSIHAELKRQLKDYKSKVSKAHEEVATFEGTVARLEAQVKRYKTAAENSEKNEEELRNERRKLQKELREAENAKAELEAERNHLVKRLERSKGLKNK